MAHQKSVFETETKTVAKAKPATKAKPVTKKKAPAKKAKAPAEKKTTAEKTAAVVPAFADLIKKSEVTTAGREKLDVYKAQRTPSGNALTAYTVAIMDHYGMLDGKAVEEGLFLAFYATKSILRHHGDDGTMWLHAADDKVTVTKSGQTSFSSYKTNPKMLALINAMTDSLKTGAPTPPMKFLNAKLAWVPAYKK